MRISGSIVTCGNTDVPDCRSTAAACRLQLGQRPGRGAGSCYASIPTGRDLRPIGPARPAICGRCSTKAQRSSWSTGWNSLRLLHPEGAAIDLFSALGSGGAGRRSQRAHRRRRGAAEPLVPESLDITPGHFLFCLIHLLQHVNG